MRYALLAAAALLPATLFAQFPAVGSYKGYVQPLGTDSRFDLLMRVEKAADSTVIKIFQDPEQPPLPLVTQYLISGGFFVEIVSLSCPLVVVAEEWEAICADPLGNPAFTLRFARKAEAPAAAPATPAPG
jgi:hypothetical protein